MIGTTLCSPTERKPQVSQRGRHIIEIQVKTNCAWALSR